jgi:hypothetical protein
LIHDERTPFCYQTIPAMEAIRDAVPREATRPGRSHVVAVYQAFTEIANQQWRTGGREGFEATREDVAEYSGCGESTVDRVAVILGKAGLLARRGRKGKPNLWVLLDPPPTEKEGCLPGTPHSQGGKSSTPGTPPLHIEEEEEVNPSDLPAKLATTKESKEKFPLSHLLSELLQASGVPPHKAKVSARWVDAERLMYERDGRDPTLAAELLRWAHAHTFWRGVILSMPNFREKFDQIRLQREREGEGPAAAPEYFDG